MALPITNGSKAAESHDGFICKHAIYTTIAACVAAPVVVHLLLLVGDLTDGPGEFKAEGWHPLVGMALAIVSLVAFGGFYIATRRFRVAITASFLLTFLIMMSFALTLPEFAETAKTDFMMGLQENFFHVVVVVVGFYFGSEALVSAAKAIGMTKAPESAPDIGRSDRDLAETPEPQTLSLSGR